MGSGTVVGLRFRYDAAIVGTLKASLARHAALAVNPREYQFKPGGWLPYWRAWFVEERIWPLVAADLAEIGCTFRERPAPEAA